MRKILLLTAIFGLVLSVQGVEVSTLDKRLIRSAESFQNVVSSKTGAIPPGLLSRAQGVLIFRQYEVGLGFGGKGGAGVALKRTSTGWSNPVFLKAGEGSWGLQIGAQRLDMIFLFMDGQDLDRLLRGNFRAGVDAAAAAGPIGGDWQGKIGAPILVYSSSSGLYVGAKFEGGIILADDDANSAFYEGASSPSAILSGRATPASTTASTLKDTLTRYEGKSLQSQKSSDEKSSGGWWKPRKDTEE
jgi:SH3 domain-containing YSC84-like protein 1